MAILKFTVDSALLNELGEKLVETVHIALVELVKNSYDADAKNVTVRFVENAKGVSELHVIDDGNGMNFNDVERYWMRIATTNKSIKDRSPKYGRPRTGSKGIGRFSCRRLGRELTLITTGKKDKSYQKTEVVFPWKKFKAGTKVTQIKCPGKKYISNKGTTGTTLIISDLIDEWNERGYGYLKRQLAILVANQGTRRDGYEDDPGFNIILEAPQFEGGLRNVREDLINAGWGTLTAYINKQGQAVCELNALGIGRKTITSKQKFTNLNDISLKIGILPESKDQLRDTRVLSKGSLREILPEWGGVQIKFKGFRVYPYGDDDWLEIDRDRGLRRGSPDNELSAFAQTLRGVDPSRALLNLLSMRNHVGYAEIGLKAKGFEMKASREGFVKSPATDELKLFTRFCIDWASIYRDYFLRKKAKEDVSVAREYLQDVTNKKIEPDKIVKSAVDYLKKEVKSISSILPAKERRTLQESFHEATDAILKHDKSNKEELRHLRVVASTSTLMLIFSHEVKSLLGTLETNESSLAIIEKKLTGEDRELVKAIRVGLKDSKARFDELLGMTSLIGIDSRKAMPGQLALLERIQKAEQAYKLIVKTYGIDVDYKDVPNNIVISSILEAELYAILLNILSNSIKSVIAAGGERKIKISAVRSEGKTIIKIMDTGVGLESSSFEDAFIPFIADPDGKLYKNLERRLNPEDKYIVGTGSGLGLSIVKEIVQVRNGTIAFNQPSENWSAELEISLP